MQNLSRWKEFWQNKADPLHHQATHEFYRRYAGELRLLFDDRHLQSVLEIGCGNGDLYEYMGFNHTAYKGVDFSPSMLESFQSKYPDVEVECHDGSAYYDKNKYELIFSNGVIQYFDRSMLRQHFANARLMMQPNSLFVCASIPWKSCKWGYRTGRLVGSRKQGIFWGCVRTFKAMRHDRMGSWYDFYDLRELAASNGMVTEFYGSMHYMYRFHAVMKCTENAPKNESAESTANNLKSDHR